MPPFYLILPLTPESLATAIRKIGKEKKTMPEEYWATWQCREGAQRGLVIMQETNPFPTIAEAWYACSHHPLLHAIVFDIDPEKVLWHYLIEDNILRKFSYSLHDGKYWDEGYTFTEADAWRIAGDGGIVTAPLCKDSTSHIVKESAICVPDR